MLERDEANQSGQITIIPKPELNVFGRNSLTKPQFKVTLAEVVIICPESMCAWGVFPYMTVI